MDKTNSPYSAAITGGGFLYDETLSLMPLLQAPDRDALLREEVLRNELLHVNAETSRKRFIAEIVRRYRVMPAAFWAEWLAMGDTDRRASLFMVILKTYKLLFDFHFNVTLRRWRSASRSVDGRDLMMELGEISARDAFVDSWSDLTKKKASTAYLSILRKVGMLDREGRLHPLRCDDYGFYLLHGEAWFLEACLLQSYQIEEIKAKLL